MALAVEEGKLPLVLPTSVARVTADGTPTKHLIDWEQLTRDWYKKNAVDMDTRLTEVRSDTDGNSAAITEETIARTNADSAFAGQLTTLSTTVGTNTADLSILSASIDGVELRHGVQGTINGVTGGYIFSGVLQLDGSVAYNMEFASNVIIYGNLVVDGTINNAQITNNAVSRSAANSSSGSSVDVSITVRAGADILLVGTIDGSGGTVVSWTTPSQLVRLQRTTGGLANINASPVSYFRDIGPTGSAQWFLLSTTIQGRYTVGSAGTYTFRVMSESGVSTGASIFAIELSK